MLATSVPCTFDLEIYIYIFQDNQVVLDVSATGINHLSMGPENWQMDEPPIMRSPQNFEKKVVPQVRFCES